MNVITINKVNCKDCYKCVRYCPVKAIRVVDGHAEVVDARCVGDGGCIGICPQHAKQVRRDAEIVRSLLASGRAVMASVAPAAAGVFGAQLPQLLGALKAVGFARVEETIRTAEAVARATAELADDGAPLISTACPAVVALVEKYFPQHAGRLAPVASPMVAHGRLLHEEHGPEIAVVFIGPCVAKKDEAVTNDVDAALTFDELREWLEEAGVVLDEQPAAAFDNPPAGRAALYPLPNGMLHAAELPDGLLAAPVMTVTGLPNVMQVMDELAELHDVRLIEALACDGGCLQGPGAVHGPPPWTRKNHLLCHVRPAGTGEAPTDLSACYPADPLEIAIPSAEEIAAILHRTGKHTPEDMHNCGACGYDTCREKAIAVFQGMAEAEMCIPHMRLRAESFANVVIRATPNGIVVVDGGLRILDANPAFTKIFKRQQQELIGRHVKSVLDAEAFAHVQRTGRPFVRQEMTYGEVIVREIIVPVVDEEIIIAIYLDITDEVARHHKLDRVRQETLGKARQVIDKQMRVAQEIAGLLGETTAETKVLLTRLIRLSEDEER